MSIALACASGVSALVAVPSGLATAAPLPNPDQSGEDRVVSAAAYGANLSFIGKGFGHGRGLSQYGSYGYAVERNLDWNQILDTYYPNTTRGTADVNATISTRLVDLDDVPAIVMHDGGRLTVGTYAPNASVPGEFTAVMIRKNSVNPTQLDVYTGTGCDPNAAGAWTLATTVSPVGDGLAARVTVDATGRNDADTNLANLLAVCEPDGQKRWYRGSFLAWLDTANAQRIANVTSVEQYLRGVVPRESPSSWGDAGGGKGINALKAQSVAARSYALSESRYLPYAQTCDTQTCQVYGGAAVASSPTAALTRIEFDNTDRAVAETAGAVRLLNGAIARAEFSSSTGGWTAGGTFPSVEDLGDATSINPNYNWQTTVARSTIEQRYPQLGTLLLVNVTKRNGLGQFGGRVRTVELRGTDATVVLTGDEMRRTFGLKSDWFFVAPPFTDTPVTAVASAASGGYWMATTDGGVYNFGTAAWAGSMSGQPLNSPVIGMASSGTRAYWLLGRDGGIFSFGGAAFYGSTGNLKLNRPVVAMAARPQADGYWFVASDGGIFSYGGA
ncbi:MAG: SpoIID/LytB domain-containing protein, partial [Acidimicrobiia bacterium]